MRFCDVFLLFRYEIKNFIIFCKYVWMVDFFRIEIDLEVVCDIIINVLYLIYVRVRKCYNFIIEYLFKILESVYDDEWILN